MKSTVFRAILKSKGYSLSQIMALSHFGYKSALDAHKDMREALEQENINFTNYCLDIARDFITDNLDSLTFDENGNVTWAKETEQ